MEAEGESELSPAEFDGGLRIPANIFNKLFDYQKTGDVYSHLISPSIKSLSRKKGCVLEGAKIKSDLQSKQGCKAILRLTPVHQL